MLIWTFLGKSGSATAIRTVCQRRIEVLDDQGLYRDLYVALFCGFQGNEASDTIGNTETREAIDTCKEYGVPMILFRFLFDPGGALVSDLTNPMYLTARILDLKQECEKLGIEHCGFETEAYGKDTPLHDYMRDTSFAAPDYDACVIACKTASNAAGWVWGITPAGKAARKVQGQNIYRWHPYMALCQNLAHNWIGQGTYYDRPREIEDATEDYPFNVAGMFVSTTKQNQDSHEKRFFLPSDVVTDRRDVWDQTRGCMAWVENNDIEVARMWREL